MKGKDGTTAPLKCSSLRNMRVSSSISRNERKTQSYVNLRMKHNSRSNFGASSNSEKLHRWMSRSVSAVSLPNTTTNAHSTVERGRECACGKPSKASLLRMKSCPVSYVQPNYREIIRKRKGFAQRCKSLSASAVRCTDLPNGESMHAFVTGARYNSAHHMDTRSLKHFGLYIPRGDASRSFVKPSGIIPPSPAIYGLKAKVKKGDNTTDSHILPAPHQREHAVSIDQEIELVFGPDPDGSLSSDTYSSSLSSAENQQEKIHDKVCAVLEEDAGASEEHNKGSVATTSTSLTNNKLQGDNLHKASSCDENITPMREETTSVDHETEQTCVIDVVDLGLKVEPQLEPVPCEDEHDDRKESPKEIEMDGDFISLEAQRLTADILRECQHSTSSFASSDHNHEAPDDMEQKEKQLTNLDSEIKEKESHEPPLDDQSANTTLETVDKALQTSFVTTEYEVPSNVGDNELKSKSSTVVFVDMSSLQLQDKQTTTSENEDIDVTEDTSP